LILDKCFLDWYLYQGANLIFTEFDIAEVAERISAAWVMGSCCYWCKKKPKRSTCTLGTCSNLWLHTAKVN